MSAAVLSLPTSVGAFIARGQDYSTVRFLSNLTREIAEASGWALTNQVKGLNFSMAMAEIARNESPQFLRYAARDLKDDLAMSTFHRRPSKIRKGTANASSGKLSEQGVTILPAGKELRRIRLMGSGEQDIFGARIWDFFRLHQANTDPSIRVTPNRHTSFLLLHGVSSSLHPYSHNLLRRIFRVWCRNHWMDWHRTFASPRACSGDYGKHNYLLGLQVSRIHIPSMVP